MKRHILIILSFLLLLGFSINQKPQWKGTIEEENGITVIKNPKEPLFGEIEFELKEDLSIGDEEDENLAFYNMVRVETDSEGNIYVLDRENCRIQKFDKDGNYLQTIGRKGQGPGEFERPYRISFDSQQNIYVHEVRDIDVFDASGKFVRTIVHHEFIGPLLGITEEGNIMAQTMSRTQEETTDEIALFDKEGKRIKTIASYKSEPLSFGKTVDLGNLYKPGLWFYPIKGSLYVYGNSSEYKIFVIDSSGELVRIIEKDESPQSISKKEINKRIDDFLEAMKKRSRGPKYTRSELKSSANFPKHYPFFFGFQTDDKSRIYVRKVKSPLDEYKGVYCDIFNESGYYLYRAKLPHSGVIKNGCLYRAARDEETGYIDIKRYKIKNWDEIKEEIN
jgi:hypothetical protein